MFKNTNIGIKKKKKSVLRVLHDRCSGEGKGLVFVITVIVSITKEDIKSILSS